MPRFTFDRERPVKKEHRGSDSNPNAYVIRENMRGNRTGFIKTKVAASRQRRNLPVTLAGKHGVEINEP